MKNLRTAFSDMETISHGYLNQTKGEEDHFSLCTCQSSKCTNILFGLVYKLSPGRKRSCFLVTFRVGIQKCHRWYQMLWPKFIGMLLSKRGNVRLRSCEFEFIFFKILADFIMTCSLLDGLPNWTRFLFDLISSLQET